MLALLESLSMQDAVAIVSAFLLLSAMAWGCSLIARLILNR